MESKHRHVIEIYTKTSFGHGDSSTHVWAKCRDCDAQTEGFDIRGFPATYDDIRQAQDEFITKFTRESK